MESQSKQEKTDKKYPWTLKRILAWICIIALCTLYVVTFILACLSSPGAGTLFKASLALTIILPIFCWVFIWAYGFLNHKKTIASMDILNSNPESRKEMEDAVHRQEETK